VGTAPAPGPIYLYARLEVGIAHRRRMGETSPISKERKFTALNGLIDVAPVGGAHL
jgi:hypothetical protein